MELLLWLAGRRDVARVDRQLTPARHVPTRLS